jgi:hypothetical protein
MVEAGTEIKLGKTQMPFQVNVRSIFEQCVRCKTFFLAEKHEPKQPEKSESLAEGQAI